MIKVPYRAAQAFLGFVFSLGAIRAINERGWRCAPALVVAVIMDAAFFVDGNRYFAEFMYQRKLARLGLGGSDRLSGTDLSWEIYSQRKIARIVFWVSMIGVLALTGMCTGGFE